MSAAFDRQFDERMMRRAIELAQLGRYTNHPNPRVGCVITLGETVVGEGWHRKWGEAHAEARALAAAGERARGATAYVTLEPHCYHGRTPPCTDALIRAGVKRVVCGTLDPNPKVSGAGVKQLIASGVAVETGLLEAEARELNLGFEKRMTSGLPRVTVKIAMSLDGRVALANGVSKWITGEPARADVQHLRAAAGAVLTGIETVIADDPQLNVRDPSIELLGRQPMRVVLDTQLRIAPAARIFSVPGHTIVFTAAEKVAQGAAIQRAGGEVVAAALDTERHVDLQNVLAELGRRECNDVLVEAGPTLAGRFLQLGLADELIVYIAPIVLGPEARAMALLPPLYRIEDVLRYTLHDMQRIGADVKLVLRP
ncbi:MAG TPA: bifunctional diaminohydroxyphosphoribosylaminopyrimidine deaminase/5-amino-6-(5-phosphoribosylamino)uracil reductase RibD [Steroidobacteraceae bacterium]|jgi:riboflavin biosynthesis protein RibD|nr:bifunctional diaminohydroxyphosphoribosylaminopyrimidine deaminase/5-amino-6-(5-phosphoribosylamino)uracil reductase RibD [Steroidobacteraceae bacterium]